MARQWFLSIRRLQGILFSFLLGFALVGILLSGMAHAGDVASSEALGKLGLGATQPETPVREISSPRAELNAGAAWLDVALYVIVVSLILVAFGLAARKVPWLRPRRPRQKP